MNIFNRLKKKPQFGGSLLGTMIATGVTLMALAGFMSNKARTAKQSKAMKSRLNYQEFEPTFRSTISKELSSFVFKEMSCEDIGSRGIKSGLPNFLLTGNSLTRAGVTFQALNDDPADAFDYLNNQNLPGGPIHQRFLDQCLDTSQSTVDRATRDNHGRPIIFNKKAMFICLRILGENLSSNIWAVVQYRFTNLITNKSYSCEDFKEKIDDPNTVNQLGGIISYQLLWTEGRPEAPRSASIQKGRMVSQPSTTKDDTTFVDPACKSQVDAGLMSNSNYKPNLIVNGEFELGTTGFTSQYTYDDLATCINQNSLRPGISYYSIAANPYRCHIAWDVLNDSKVAFFNGAGRSKFWCATINVDKNKDYHFGVDERLLHADGGLTSSRGSSPIRWTINGRVELSRQYLLRSWETRGVDWNSGNATTATICGQNLSGNDSGNDWAIDNLCFVEK